VFTGGEVGIAVATGGNLATDGTCRLAVTRGGVDAGSRITRFLDIRVDLAVAAQRSIGG